MAESAQPSTEGRARQTSRRTGDLAWAAVWLLFLVAPAITLPDLEPAWPAAAGLGAFALGYLVLVRTCWTIPLDAGWPSVPQLAGLGLVAALGVTLAAVYSGDSGNWLLVLVYVGAAGAVMLPWRPTNAWLVGTVVAVLVIGAARSAPAADLAIMALVVVLAGVLSVSFRHMSELIAHLRRTQAELAQAAATAERVRISRDLHDLLGHTLSLIVVKAEVLRRSAGHDPDAAAREAGEIEDIGRRALSEVREAVTGYRERPFATELDAARTALTEAGLTVTVRTEGTPLPAPADSLFGWVVREAATNVVRHSDARHCAIEVRRADGHVTLDVRDDGMATGVALPDGSGLSGLAERLAEAGGRLDAGASDHGWRVTATVPVAQP